MFITQVLVVFDLTLFGKKWEDCDQSRPVETGWGSSITTLTEMHYISFSNHESFTYQTLLIKSRKRPCYPRVDEVFIRNAVRLKVVCRMAKASTSNHNKRISNVLCECIKTATNPGYEDWTVDHTVVLVQRRTNCEFRLSKGRILLCQHKQRKHAMHDSSQSRFCCPFPLECW